MGKQRIDLLLLVEHTARELDVACAVKYLMAEKYAVEIEIASIVDAHGFQKMIAKSAARGDYAIFLLCLRLRPP